VAWPAATTETTESVMTALRFTEHLVLHGIAPSVGSVGANDNVLMGSVIGLFTTECTRTTVSHAGAYKAVSDAEYATAGRVDRWNNRRLHGTLGVNTPNEAEQAHYAALIPQEQPACERHEPWGASPRLRGCFPCGGVTAWVQGADAVEPEGRWSTRRSW